MEPNDKSNLDRLLDTDQAADFLNVPPRRLEAWRLLREGPKYIAFNSRSVRYRMRDLLAYLDAHTVSPEDYPLMDGMLTRKRRRKDTSEQSSAESA